MTKILTYDDLADFYKNKTGRSAKIMPMNTVYEWATKQKEIKVIDEEGRLSFKKDTNNTIVNQK